VVLRFFQNPDSARLINLAQPAFDLSGDISATNFARAGQFSLVRHAYRSRQPRAIYAEESGPLSLQEIRLLGTSSEPNEYCSIASWARFCFGSSSACRLGRSSSSAHANGHGSSEFSAIAPPA